MAKKQTQVFVPAALADVKWINTPFAYASLSKDLTLLQQSVLLMVSDKLQDFIARFFERNGHQSKSNPNGLFFPEDLEQLPRIEIDLRDFGLGNTHNIDIEESAKAVADLKIKAPDPINGGYSLFPIFDEVKVSKQDESPGSEMIKYNQRTGKMVASINPKVAAYAFNMRLGYINHPLRIASDASQIYSPRLYFLIKHYLQKGKTKVTIPYASIRTSLGIDKVDPLTEKVIEQIYPVFSRFCTNVLDKAQADIERMGKLNLIDITFTYEPIYKWTTKRGDPESIEFTITPTALGTYHRDPKKAREHMDVKRTADAQGDDTSAPRKRGRPRKVKPMDDSPSLFDGVGEEQPARIIGDKCDLWQQVITQYEGPLQKHIVAAKYMGTDDGHPWIEFSSYIAMTDYSESKGHDNLQSLVARIYNIERGSIKISYAKQSL